ncbi:MAG TPA: hypothetical protein PKI01_00115 [Bacteroidales bacterium]|nr:hypothetical protein [Bacteroidales bacterium]
MKIKTEIFQKGNKNVINNNDIYSLPSNGVIFSPFSFNIDPMEYLILINFEKDPDEYYNSLEFQQACDKNGKRRLLVIAYRTDGATDIYYQPGFPFGSQDSVLNNAGFFERPLENAKFEVNVNGIEVNFILEDKIGREIKVRVNESKRQKKNPFFLLAPVGANSLKPKSLPIYSLYEMSFTKQKYTNIEIEIDKVKHKPDTFPMPIDGSKNYFTRYSVDTFNVDWNKNFKGPLSPLTPDNNCKIEDLGTTYDIEEKSGHYEIKRMSTKNKKHKISIEFYPAIPDVVCLRQGVEINGNFSIKTDDTAGTIGGNYQIKRHENDIDFTINPTGGWEPNESRLVLKILFFVVKIFKEWPKSYVWNAQIRLDDAGQPIMQSAWKRI